MRHYRLFIVSIAALSLLTACTAQKMDAPAVKNTAISLTSQVQTRATADPQTTALSTSNTVGVFVTSGQATITNGNNNEHSVDATGALTTSNTMNYPSEDGTKVNIYAYAPYASGMALSSDNAFSVSTDQSADSGYLASDLVYASVADQASTESAVALNFAHKLSQLQIVIQNNEAIDLSNAVVSVTGTNIDASFNTQTGAVTAAETANVKDIKAATINAATTVYAVVVPQTIAANTQLVKITTASKVYVAKLATEATLAGGKAYKFTVNLGENTEVYVSDFGGYVVNAPTGTDDVMQALKPELEFIAPEIDWDHMTLEQLNLLRADGSVFTDEQDQCIETLLADYDTGNYNTIPLITLIYPDGTEYEANSNVWFGYDEAGNAINWFLFDAPQDLTKAEYLMVNGNQLQLK